MIKVLCDYCGKPAELVTGKQVYPYRVDLHSLVFFRCVPCDARVGTHKRTKKPLGRLANAELRLAKGRAHAAFDPLWKDGEMSRHRAYRWLAKQIGIAPDDCHIGMFDLEQCRAVVRAVRERSHA